MTHDPIAFLDDLYAAALNPGLWERALQSYVDLFSGSAANIELHRKTEPMELAAFSSVGLDLEMAELYTEYYRTVCPRFEAVAGTPIGTIACDYDCLSESDMERSEFYLDFLGRHDLRYFLSATMEQSAEYLGVVVVQRSPKQGHPTDDQVELASRLVPHLARAMQFRHAIASDISDAETFMGHHSCGLVIVDGTGKVLELNEKAQEILRDHSGFSSGTHFTLRDPRSARKIRRLVASAARLSEGDARTTMDAVVARGQTRDDDVTVLVAPYFRRLAIPLLRDLPRVESGRAVILLRPQKIETASWSSQLGNLFSLTPAELRLAIAWVEGQTLAQYAEACAVSINTIKTHWRGLRQKTQTRSQSEFIRLALRLFPDFSLDEL